MSVLGKWMYNTGDEEHWNCDEGEFDTKEDAIAAGIKYFTDADEFGYEYHNDEKFDGVSFEVGLVSEPDMHINAWSVIDMVTEQVYDQCGEYADGWLQELEYEEQKLLGDMLTKTFKKWIDKTSNNPRFYTMKNVELINLNEN